MASALLVVLILAVNLFISYWNAKVVGQMWVETKRVGGWTRFMAYMGWIMSASGFTWCYLIIAGFSTYYIQFAFLKADDSGVVDPLITWAHLEAGFSLGYLILIPGILFSGLMIWVDSMVQAYQRRDFASIGRATWNTYAQIHNTYSAMRGAPEAFEKVFDVFLGKGNSRNGKGKGAMLMLMIVVLAIIAGVLTTWSIVNKYAGTRAVPRYA